MTNPTPYQVNETIKEAGLNPAGMTDGEQKECYDRIARAGYAISQPRFRRGDGVSHIDRDQSSLMGQVKDRYLNSAGEWVYVIRFQDGSGQCPFIEDELAPFADSHPVA